MGHDHSRPLSEIRQWENIFNARWNAIFTWELPRVMEWPNDYPNSKCRIELLAVKERRKEKKNLVHNYSPTMTRNEPSNMKKAPKKRKKREKKNKRKRNERKTNRRCRRCVAQKTGGESPPALSSSDVKKAGDHKCPDEVLWSAQWLFHTDSRPPASPTPALAWMQELERRTLCWTRARRLRTSPARTQSVQR